MSLGGTVPKHPSASRIPAQGMQDTSQKNSPNVTFGIHKKQQFYRPRDASPASKNASPASTSRHNITSRRAPPDSQGSADLKRSGTSDSVWFYLGLSVSCRIRQLLFFFHGIDEGLSFTQPRNFYKDTVPKLHGISKMILQSGARLGLLWEPII